MSDNNIIEESTELLVSNEILNNEGSINEGSINEESNNEILNNGKSSNLINENHAIFTEMLDENQIDEKICRICLESENPDQLIAPCLCNGNSKFVHRYCLDTWRYQNINSENFRKCRECLFEYRIENVEIQYPMCKKILNFFSKFVVFLYLIIVVIIYSLCLFYQAIGFKNKRNIEEFRGVYLYQDAEFMAIATFLISTTIILIIHDIYTCCTYRSPLDYYRNYANCGICAFTIFYSVTVILFLSNSFFGIIAVTLLIQSIFRYIFETRYNFSIVESLRVMDLNENRIS